jgi:phthalate 4,5-cis-dihydrodiol dehydrogenase
MSTTPIRLGVLGMGRAFTLMLPTWVLDPRIQMVAACDGRPSALRAFEQDFGGRAHDTPQSLCADPEVEWVYVATPHGLHAEHVEMVAAHGKHALVEKPMALTLSDCDRMIRACDAAGTHLMLGHSHSFDGPVRLARQLIDSGQWGAVRMIHAMNFTDFLYRPRRPEELDTALGGGVVFSQAAHQVDIVRLLAGGMARTVHAHTGAWDASRPTEGAYMALMDFENEVVANLTYNGYGHYDSDVLMEGIGEMAEVKSPHAHQTTRMKLAAASSEAAEAQQKAERNYGGSQYPGLPNQWPDAHQHFGPVIVSCERGDLRLTPLGVQIHDQQGVRLEKLPAPTVPRCEVVDEIWAVAREQQKPRHDGPWSKATLEVCLSILASSRQRRTIELHHQVPWQR